MVKFSIGVFFFLFFQFHYPSIFNAAGMILPCIFFPCLFLGNVLVYCKNRLLRILSVALVMAIGFGLIGTGIQTIKLSHESITWPSVKGQIFISEKTKVFNGASGTVREINYRYLIQDKKYSNNEVSWRAAQEGALFQKYKQDQHVAVYYNPAQPKQSILEPGFGWLAPTKLFYGIAVSFAGILSCCASVEYSRDK